MTDKVAIRQLPTSVTGLDQILGGGLPEFSFNLIVGVPGSGKTTLAHQIMFGLATPERRAVYFTVVGEPPLKMLRYQQQYQFFDLDRVGDSIRFVSVGQDIVEGTLDQLLERITAEVEATNPGLVFVDSFRTVAQVAEGSRDGGLNLQSFVQQLAIRLTGWEATTFLIGEYQPNEAEHDPVFTVADGLLWLHQSLDRNSMVRKIQVKKMRGQGPVPGLHTFRITDGGIDVFPRVIVGPSEDAKLVSRKRLLLDIDELDEMLGGGIPEGYSVLVAGPSGSGKSVLATEFIMAGIRHDEPGILAVFEKRPNEYSQTPPGGRKFGKMIQEGKVGVIHSRPLDLSIDETLYEIVEQVERLKARRLVVDSLSGFELALAPTFREDFRESLYRMVAVLTGMGVTMMMTAELEDTYTELRFSPHGTAFLTDVIIMQRYIELKGCLQRVISVVKVRGSAHSKEIRAYEINKTGIEIGARLRDYNGLLTGHPHESSGAAPSVREPQTRKKRP
ncbi:MAG TPA: ATPase domain-containing protein [Thermoanaerobaculia bacterium]|nr:ATPase domain-containing protein [Thermoanaerobaculia bacterium]